MPAELLMPQLSDAMDEGTVSRWCKQPGDTIVAGEPLVEIETDKATVEHEAEADGVLLEILVGDGESAPLGTPIARIGAPGETLAAATASATSATSPGAPRRRRASPVARRFAHELGVELAELVGTGPHGRIVKADVLAAAERSASATAADVGSTTRDSADEAPVAPSADRLAGEGATAASAGSRFEQPTRIQRLVARRMAESTATVPDFVLFRDVTMDACLELRARLKQLDAAAAPSVNDIVVKAVALALREHPRANGSYRDERFELHDRVNVGVAVASDEGLVVPTIVDADVRSLGAIAQESRRLAAAVRDGSVTPADLADGTFTVSNLGMFGVDAFTAIVNPPQAAILAVGAIRRQPVAHDDDTVGVASVMTLGLVSDHRILNGADAARFLARIGELLEQPLAMAL